MSNALPSQEELSKNPDPVELFGDLNVLDSEQKRFNYLRDIFLEENDVAAYIQQIDNDGDIDLSQEQLIMLTDILGGYMPYLRGYLERTGERIRRLDERFKVNAEEMEGPDLTPEELEKIVHTRTRLLKAMQIADLPRGAKGKTLREVSIDDDRKICEELMMGDLRRIGKLNNLPAEVAKKIVSVTPDEESLSLGGLTSLSAESARELAQHKGSINLAGLKILTDEAAKELGNHQSWLWLDGLESISDGALQGLLKHRGCLSLNGLRHLSMSAFNLFGRHVGWLSLQGLTSLTPSEAKLLGKHKGRLWLTGLTDLSVDVANGLKNIEGTLGLDGLTSLTPKCARALSKVSGASFVGKISRHYVDRPLFFSTPEEAELSLRGVKDLNMEALKELARFQGDLNIVNYTLLNSEQAREIAKHKGPLALGAKKLDLSMAEALVQHEGELYINLEEDLYESVAEALANHKGEVYVSAFGNNQEKIDRYRKEAA